MCVPLTKLTAVERGMCKMSREGGPFFAGPVADGPDGKSRGMVTNERFVRFSWIWDWI
jgi:hypothetical protein